MTRIAGSFALCLRKGAILRTAIPLAQKKRIASLSGNQLHVSSVTVSAMEMEESALHFTLYSSSSSGCFCCHLSLTRIIRSYAASLQAIIPALIAFLLSGILRVHPLPISGSKTRIIKLRSFKATVYHISHDDQRCP